MESKYITERVHNVFANRCAFCSKKTYKKKIQSTTTTNCTHMLSKTKCLPFWGGFLDQNTSGLIGEKKWQNKEFEAIHCQINPHISS